MKLSARKNKWEFVAVGALLVILIALGVLQNRWLGEISDAERDRQMKDLSASADDLTNEFDREITRLYIRLQVSLSNRSLPENYQERYEQWRATALYPKLIGNIFFVLKDDAGAIRLNIYNPATRRFEESEWTPVLAAVREKIERDLNRQNGDFADVSETGNDKIDNDLILIPAAILNLPGSDTNRSAPLKTSSPVRRVGYTIISLDTDYLKDELLPMLATRHFQNSKDSGGDYRISIKERKGEKNIYQSARLSTDENFEETIERDFFRVKLSELANIIPSQVQSSEISPADPQGKRSGGIIIASGRQTILSESSVSGNKSSLTGAFEPRWKLVAATGGGSLNAVVGKTRLRNTFVSSAILLLLGACGIWLLILSNRSRKFADRQKNFVASVSHELRTPLAVIRSLSENLADGIVKSENQIREYGAVINDEERRLSAMVEKMLDYAASRKSLNVAGQSPQDVSEIIERALTDHQRELESKNFEIEKLIAADLPLINADSDALRRAFGNLIDNAVKYSRDEKRIKIQAVSIENRQFVEIRIEDCGPGISAEELPDIFELFYRGQKARSGQIRGTGIGLSLVKQIIESHGGTITVSSKLNQGSTFIIRLPAASHDSLDNDKG